jgi:hypothetical protein
VIVHKLLPDGGFVCGDTETRITSYAYPTSTHATSAKRNPTKVAAEMMANQVRYGLPHEVAYDELMWGRLEV